MNYLFCLNDNINIIKINKTNKVDAIIIISLVLILSFNYYSNAKKNNENVHYQQDEVTIISAYYKVKSKHKPRDYFDWIRNFMLLNKSIVFFASNKIIPRLKSFRPKDFENKTIFIATEMEDFFSYQNFHDEFEKSFSIDFEKIHHSFPLYLVWAEKCTFLKKVITKNYFNSNCFYWIDAGYLREKNIISKYFNNWPSTKKCYEDPRLLMGQVKNFSDIEKQKILNFDYQAHIRLRKNINVVGGIFGGQPEKILKFINLYYETIKLFIKKGIFIGKDQNIFTYVSFAHPEVVKLIYCRNYTEYREHIA